MATIQEKFDTWLGIEVWRSPRFFNRREIAEELNVTKSPSLIQVLEQAVALQILDEVTLYDSRSLVERRYLINTDYRESQFQGVKKNG